MRIKIILIGFALAFLGRVLPVQAENAYGIGSVSKIYTTAAIMKLAEEDKVDLDAPVTEYLPEFTMADERYREITVRMLLNHTSGLQGSNYRNSMTLGGASSENHDTLLATLANQRLKANPGELSVYCNDGFTLAELIVESVTGMSFTNYIKMMFQEPLELSFLESSQSNFDKASLEPIYLNGGRELPFESANVISSGGIYSTAEDVAKFFQIFTSGYYKGENPILSPDSVKEMEQPTYSSKIWPGVGTQGASVAFGLGWDSVEEYPYKAYGMKALSKGGDTTNYHSGVTVLPEENISCAVLTSGKASGAAGLAVQKIIMEYLEEEGLLKETNLTAEESNGSEEDKVTIPEQIREKVGFYATGSSVIKVTMPDEFSIELQSKSDGREMVMKGTYLGNETFLIEEPGYISLSGDLMFAESGTYGKTKLSFREGNGKTYLISDTVENSPGLGNSHNLLPMAEKIEDNPLNQDQKKRWETWSEEDYLLVSEEYKSANYLRNPMAGFSLTEIEGYVQGRGMFTNTVKIIDENYADFFQQIPGHAGRDLVTLTLEEEGKASYLNNENYRFIKESSVPTLEKVNQTITIKDSKEALWFLIPEDETATGVTITAPKNGHFYIYKKENENMVCTASSITGDASNLIFLPRGGRIAFAGESGAAFEIAWDQSAN